MTVSRIQRPVGFISQFVTGCQIHPAYPFEWLVIPHSVRDTFSHRSFSKRYGDQRNVANEQSGLIAFKFFTRLISGYNLNRLSATRITFHNHRMKAVYI
jgi:hypothetical protein